MTLNDLRVLEMTCRLTYCIEVRRVAWITADQYRVKRRSSIKWTEFDWTLAAMQWSLFRRGAGACDRGVCRQCLIYYRQAINCCSNQGATVLLVHRRCFTELSDSFEYWTVAINVIRQFSWYTNRAHFFSTR